MSTFDQEGGAEDMPPPPEHEQRAEFQFQVGDIVSPDDRGNQGVVIAVEPGCVQVQIVDKHTGLTSELFFHPAALKLVKRIADARRLTILSYAELQALPPSRWLIQGILRMGELAALYGAPGSGKSFMAIDMALRIALGDSWAGRACARGRVLYIAGEGLYTIQGRTRAWAQQFQEVESCEQDLNGWFEVVGDAVSFIETEFELLIEAIGDQQYVLIIVDTLARCMAGGDENDAGDMGLFVRAGDRLRKLTGAAVLIVHHAGKTDERIERGSSALRGACDAMYVSSLEREKVFRISCEKQKEGEPFADIEFGLNIVEIGTDEFGEPRRSGRLLFQGAATDKKDGRGEDKRDADEVIQKTLAESFFEDGAADSALLGATQLKRATYYRHLRKLVDAGLLVRTTKGRASKYTLTPKSAHYKAPPPPPEEPSPSPSPTESHETSGETQDPTAASSPSQSHPPSLKRGERDENETASGPAKGKQSKRKQKKPQQKKGGGA